MGHAARPEALPEGLYAEAFEAGRRAGRGPRRANGVFGELAFWQCELVGREGLYAKAGGVGC